MTLATIAGLRAQSEVTPANKLYQQAVVEINRASKLERHGKKQAAIDAYELGGQLAEASIAEAERSGLAEEERHAGGLFSLRHLLSPRRPIA